MNLWRSAGVVPEPAKGVVWSIAAALDHQVLYYLHASYVNALTFFKIDQRGVITFDYTPSVYENPNMGKTLLAPMSIALNYVQTYSLCPLHPNSISVEATEATETTKWPVFATEATEATEATKTTEAIEWPLFSGQSF